MVILDLKNLVVNKQMVCCRPRSVVPTKGLFRLIHGFVLSQIGADRNSKQEVTVERLATRHCDNN